MFKDYYKSLHLGRAATAEEIKRSFRQLAKKYHPDSNPDPRAQTIFQEINEAHQTLGDARKRMRYNLKYDYYQQKGKPPPVFYHTFQQARQAYKPRKRSEPVSKFWKGFAKISIVFVVFSAILIGTMVCDALIQEEKDRMVISSVTFVTKSFLVKTDKTEFYLSPEYKWLLGKGMEIDVYYTRLYHVLNKIRIFPDIEEEELKPLFPESPILFRPYPNIYSGVFLFLAIIMVLIYFLIPKKDAVYIACGNTFIGLLGMMLLAMLFNSAGV